MINEGALIADMSAGSVQLSLFSEGALSFTQKLKLGASRKNFAAQRKAMPYMCDLYEKYGS